MHLPSDCEVTTSFEQVLEQLGTIAQHLQQCADLKALLTCGVQDVRALLGGDRVLVYQFLPRGDGVVLAESVGAGWSPIVGQLIHDPCFIDRWIEPYRQGRVSHVSDLATSDLAPCHRDLLTQFQVKANLVVPILTRSQASVPLDKAPQLWGLLIIHQCATPRTWKALEIQILKQIALHLGMALQQMQLHQQLQQQMHAGRWQFALEGVGDGLWDWNIETNEVYYSPQWKAMLGYGEDEIGNTLYEWDSRIHPQYRDVVYTAMERHLSRQTSPYVSEHPLRCKDGSWKWVLDRGQVMQWTADGKPLRVVGIHTDISDRKVAETALHQSQEQWDTLLNSLEDYLIVADTAGQILAVNQSLVQGLGYTHSELLAMQLLDLHPPEYHQRAAETIAEMIAGQQACCTLPLLAKDGTYIAVETKVKRGTWQNRPALFGICRDIRDRQRAQDLLLLHSAALNASANVIMISDRQGTIEWINPAFTTLTGYTLEEAIGKNPRDLLKSAQQDAAFYDQLWHTISAGQVWRGELVNRRKDGSVYSEAMTITPVQDGQGEILHFIAIKQDVTERHRMEQHLRDRDEMLRKISEQVPGVVYQYQLYPDGHSYFPYASEAIRQIYAVTPAQVQQDAQVVFERLHPDDQPSVTDRIWTSFHTLELWHDEYRVILPERGLRWLEGHAMPERLADGSVLWHGYIWDITDRKHTEALLQQEFQRERMVHIMNHHMRKSLDLETILQTTVAEVLQFLEADRVVIYRLNLDWSGMVVAESLAPGWVSLLNREMTDSYFVETQGGHCHQDSVHVIADIYAENLSECHIQMLEGLQVKAQLMVPILQSDRPWGLLIVHQCRSPRPWQPAERSLLQQLSGQMAIAIQQSELYAQVQRLNADLESQVQDRTAQLQQSLDFEALLKRITDKVRDSLDEQQIIQAAVEELAQGLPIEACDAGIYNANQTTSTIVYEFTHTLSVAQGLTLVIAQAPHPEIYPYLFQGQHCQFCDVAPNPVRSGQRLLTVLACPIVDDQGVLGDLWLFKATQQVFNDLEVRLVQQVANQFAIALRQARLYQAAQQQVQELERLNRLKDDFLSTVSHELRTPMSSIKMAAEMLEGNLKPLGLLADETHVINRYFHIIEFECQREINLIDNLLELTHLDAAIEPLHIVPVDLQFLLPHIAEPFLERTRQHQQQLTIEVPEVDHKIRTDLFYLERCITELLNNACKYTPAGENIRLFLQATPGEVAIHVENCGVTLLETEYDRIFDKFYRIPNNDPWKYGGTGLGLALVKKMVDRLGGRITVASQQNLITLTLHLPRNSPSSELR